MSLRSPRIQDVARAAGVSTATVSRTLSNPDLVAEDTRKLVLDAVASTGYRINPTARNLRRRTTGAIVVLVPNLGNPFFSLILAGIETVASANSFSVLIADTEQSAVKADLAIEYLHNHRADGLIVLDASLPMAHVPVNLPKFSPHVVFACERPAGAKKLISVTVDNHQGAAIVIRHLHGLGHDRIGHVAGPASNVLTVARREGMIRELQKRNLPVRREWFFAGDFSIESGARAARQWLALGDRPTAVFCSSDQMAFGFISELHGCGIGIPADVSVVGFDDIEIASRFIPALTTIRQPRIEIGAIAAEILIRRISGEHLPDDTSDRRLPVELMVRNSTGPAPRG